MKALISGSWSVSFRAVDDQCDHIVSHGTQLAGTPSSRSITDLVLKGKGTLKGLSPALNGLFLNSSVAASYNSLTKTRLMAVPCLEGIRKCNPTCLEGRERTASIGWPILMTPTLDFFSSSRQIVSCLRMFMWSLPPLPRSLLLFLSSFGC